MGLAVSLKVPSSGAWWCVDRDWDDRRLVAAPAPSEEDSVFELLVDEESVGKRWTLRKWIDGTPVGTEGDGLTRDGDTPALLTCTSGTEGEHPDWLRFNQAMIVTVQGREVGVDPSDGRLCLVDDGAGTPVEVHLPRAAWRLYNRAGDEDDGRISGYLNAEGRLAVEPGTPSGPGEDGAEWLFWPRPEGTYTITSKRWGLAWTSVNDRGPVGLGVAEPWRVATFDGRSLTITHEGEPYGGLSAQAGGATDIGLVEEYRDHPPTSWEPEGRDVVSRSVFTELESTAEGFSRARGYTARRFAAWMSFLSDDVRVQDLVLPGTHDSATYNMGRLEDDLGGAVTQDLDLLGQLLAGARYLDLRVRRRDDGTLVVQHGRLNGEPFAPMVDDIALFLRNVPTEFLILDLIVPEDCAAELRDILALALDADVLAATEFVRDGRPDPGVTLGTLRRNGRRFLTLWDNVGPSPRPWQAPRNTVLWDSYDEDVWESDVAGIVTAITAGMRSWMAPTGPHRDQLSKIQALSTPKLSITQPATGAAAGAAAGALAGAVVGPLGAAVGAGLGAAGVWISSAAGAGGGPRQIEKRDGGALTEWVRSLTSESGVNIVVRDFIDANEETVATLIGLNAQRGHEGLGSSLSSVADLDANPVLDEQDLEGPDFAMVLPTRWPDLDYFRALNFPDAVTS